MKVFRIVTSILMGVSSYLVMLRITGKKRSVYKTELPKTALKGPVKSEVKQIDLRNTQLIQDLTAYDYDKDRRLVHIRLQDRTVDLLTKFKLATGVDMNKFISFAVERLINTTPSFKNIIQQYLKDTEL